MHGAKVKILSVNIFFFCEFNWSLLIFLTNEGLLFDHSTVKIIFPQYSSKYFRVNLFM
jgi:hypothetical protein